MEVLFDLCLGDLGINTKDKVVVAAHSPSRACYGVVVALVTLLCVNATPTYGRSADARRTSVIVKLGIHTLLMVTAAAAAAMCVCVWVLLVLL